MRIISLLLLMTFLTLFSCKSREAAQDNNLNINKNLTDEEYSEQPGFENFHAGWVFKPGEYYLLSDAIIYENPNSDSRKIGNINIHKKISVIEDMHNEQKIDGTRSCWYKIKYNKLIGYIFGGNIAIRTLICDIDKNGVLDYFQYRYSWVAANWHMDTREDVVIYINNKKIETNKLRIEEYEKEWENYSFNFCSFEQNGNEVIVELSGGGPASSEDSVFSVDMYGNILLKSYVKKGSFWENDEWVEYE